MITLHEFKDKYNIYLNDDRVEEAINYALGKFESAVSDEKSYVFSKTGDTFKVPLDYNYYIFDRDFDGLDSNDVTITQYNNEDFSEQDITSDTTTLKQFYKGNSNFLVFKFSSEKPDSGYTHIEVKYSVTPMKVQTQWVKDMAKTYAMLNAFWHLLVTSDKEKLQTGIAKWDFSGTQIEVDSSTIKDVIEDVENKIAYVHNNLMPIVTRTYRPDASKYYFDAYTSKLYGRATRGI